MRSVPLLLPLVLLGCAASPSGGGAILIETVSRGQSLEGANCTIYGSSRSWKIVTPASIAINRIEGDLRMICERAGFRPSELILRPTGQSSPGMGLGIGGGSGNVGVGVGFSVPLGSGAWSYPGRVSINMNPA